MQTKWTEIKIGDFIESGEAELKTGPFGTQLHASDYVEIGTPVINVRNIGYGDIREDKLEFIGKETVQRLSSHLLEKDDIVFGRKGAVDRHAFIKDHHSGWFQGSDCLRLRIQSSKLVPRFVSYYFLTERHKEWMFNQCSHGATMASLNQRIVGDIPLRLPSIAIQRKITAVLSSYDDLIENNTRRIAILEEMAQALYREWFVYFRFPGHEQQVPGTSEVPGTLGNGRLPKGWELVQVTSAIEFNPRLKVTHDIEKPYLLMEGLSTTSMLIDTSSLKTKTGVSGSKFQNQDTLMARITPSLENGKTGFVQFLPTDDAISLGSTEFIVMRSKTLTPEYVYCLARSNHFRDTAIKSMIGASGRQRVQLSCFDDYLIAHPHNQLLNQFTNAIKPIFKMIHLLAKKNANLRQTRDLLLPRLISGELDVSHLPLPTTHEEPIL